MGWILDSRSASGIQFAIGISEPITVMNNSLYFYMVWQQETETQTMKAPGNDVHEDLVPGYLQIVRFDKTNRDSDGNPFQKVIAHGTEYSGFSATLIY